MDAILCNAGKGTRLGDLDVPKKCLIRDPHSGKSILWYQLEALYEIGVEKAIVVVAMEDAQVPTEVERLRDRFPDMVLKCVSGNTETLIDSVSTGLQFVSSDRVIRLDGDVCLMGRDVLLPIKNQYKNTLCCYMFGKEHIHPSLPIIEGGYDQPFPRISFWSPSYNGRYAWACIDLWETEILKEMVRTCPPEDKGYVMKNINRLLKEGAHIGTVVIPSVYEVDTPEDYVVLQKIWEQNVIELERKSLEFWKSREQYPKFRENKDRRLEVDHALYLEFCKEGERVVDIGAGRGYLIHNVLKERSLREYIVVEPNTNWCQCLNEELRDWDNVRILPKSFAQYCSSGLCSDVAILFGSILYMVWDRGLRQSLTSLKANTLLVKASEPNPILFDRLLVNQFSKDLNCEYISIYRSIGDVCKLLRDSGWSVKEIRKDIYSEGLESAFGNQSFLIVAERSEKECFS